MSDERESRDERDDESTLPAAPGPKGSDPTTQADAGMTGAEGEPPVEDAPPTERPSTERPDSEGQPAERDGRAGDGPR